jgi:hypothetical protein
MTNALKTYLNDHLAGSAHAISLTEFIRDRNLGTSLGQFASDLLREITEDRNVLMEIAKSVGAAPSTVKQAVGWIGEKATRIKLGAASSREFGTMEALELLELGIHGKWAMWRALASLADSDSRLRGRDYDALLRRAERQRDSVESQRLQIALMSLRPAA